MVAFCKFLKEISIPVLVMIPIFGTAFTLPVAAESRAAADGLLGYWALDDGSGETARDKSPSQNDARISNGNWAGKPGGTALEFNGKNTHLVIPHKPYLNLKDELCVEAWIYPTDVNGTLSFFNKGPSNFMSGYNFTAKDGMLGFEAKTEKFGGMSKNFNWFKFYTDSPVLQANRWSNVAVTYSARENRVCLYLDGKPVKEGKAGGSICHLDGQEDYGAATSAMSAYPRYSYFRIKGFLRDLSIYGRALQPAEIAEEYQKNRAAVTGLGRQRTLEETLREKRTAGIDGKIVDADTGKEIEAKVFISGEDGTHYWPDGSFSYGNSAVTNVRYFYSLTPFTVKVCPGNIHITAMRGFEYQPAELALNVKDGESKPVVVKLKRAVSMPQMGWYSGEDELQYCASHGEGGPNDYYRKMMGAPMPDGFVNPCRILKGEGLNWANFVSDPNYWKGSGWNDKYYGLVDSADFTARHGFELRGMLGGDIICINTGSRTGHQVKGANQYEQLEDALNSGAASALSDGMGEHIYDRDISNPKLYLCSRLWPVWVALNKVNRYHHAFLPLNSAGMSATYRLLNLGFKATQASGTDIYMLFAEASTAPGYLRTYARLDKLAWPDLAKAYNGQNLFVTDGPLVIFRVGGKDVGETVKIPGDGGQALECSVYAFSLNGMDKVEIVKNGAVVKTLTAQNGGAIKEDFKLPVSETCWIAARAYGMSGKYVGTQAHTSPVYVQHGTDGMKPDPEDIKYFAGWIEKIRAVIPEFEKNFKEKQDWVIPLLDQADGVFKSVTGKPRTWIND